jgi:hypothetical protein
MSNLSEGVGTVRSKGCSIAVPRRGRRKERSSTKKAMNDTREPRRETQSWPKPTSFDHSAGLQLGFAEDQSKETPLI